MTEKSGNKLVCCGNSCHFCPQYKDGRCSGCSSEVPDVVPVACAVRTCCRERDLVNCAWCPDYGCDILAALYARWAESGFAEGAAVCRSILDEINRAVRAAPAPAG